MKPRLDLMVLVPAVPGSTYSILATASLSGLLLALGWARQARFRCSVVVRE
jgi:hypothetical protein